MARIELKNVRKQWVGATAVERIDLAIDDGAFVAVLGPSGCGKTTTLLMLAGIYSPSGGEIAFDGARVNDVEARDRNVGIVFQSYALYPNMTVLENIMFPLRFKKVERAEAEARAREIAALVRIDALLDRRPSQLSGGQQQRVALARALVKRPHLLLLDEPLSNLDAALRLSMRTEIRRVQRELGVTTILVTHDQIEATTMADRIVVMNAGSVEQEGTAKDLYERPETLFVAGFVGSPPINLLEGEVEDGAIKVHEARLRLDCPSPRGRDPRHPAGESAGRQPRNAGARRRRRTDGPRGPLYGGVRVRPRSVSRTRRRGTTSRRRERRTGVLARGRAAVRQGSGRRLEARIAA